MVEPTNLKLHQEIMYVWNRMFAFGLYTAGLIIATVVFSAAAIVSQLNTNAKMAAAGRDRQTEVLARALTKGELSDYVKEYQADARASKQDADRLMVSAKLQLPNNAN